MTVVIRATSVGDDPRLQDLLDDSELERAARRRNPRPFVTAHALLRSLLADETGADPRSFRFARRCPTCGSDSHGKPYAAGLPDVHLSVSYGDDGAVAAVTTDGEVGVDIEKAASTNFDGFAAVTLAPTEHTQFATLSGEHLLRARAQIWARKEALLKATGHGLVVQPSQVVVTPWDEPAGLVDWTADELSPGPTWMADREAPGEKHQIAVAVLTSAEPELHIEFEGCTSRSRRDCDVERTPSS